jgi:hypothetical protein
LLPSWEAPEVATIRGRKKDVKRNVSMECIELLDGILGIEKKAARRPENHPSRLSRCDLLSHLVSGRCAKSGEGCGTRRKLRQKAGEFH